MSSPGRGDPTPEAASTVAEHAPPTAGVDGRRLHPAAVGLRRDLTILVSLAVAFGLSGLLVTGFWSVLLAQIFLWAAMSTAWNLLGGMAGYVSLGSQAFFGLGAYALGVAMRQYGWPFLPALALAGLFGALTAWLIGYPILRIRGHYFILGSFAVGAALAAGAVNVRWFGIGGGGSLNLPMLGLPASQLNAYFYFVMLGLAVLSLLVYILVDRSRMGLALRMIRADEDIADALGVDTTRYKLIAFALSGALFGLAGGARAYWTSRIDAVLVFDAAIIIQILVMVVLGGVGTTWGPALGAAVILLLTQFAGSFQNLNVIVYAAIIIAITLFRPGGLMQLLSEIGGLFSGRRAERARTGAVAVTPTTPGSEPSGGSI